MVSTHAIREFCRIARARSGDNEEAMGRLDGLPGQQVGVLRQELDSMVKAIWLKSCDVPERDRLCQVFLKTGEFRKSSGGRISEAEMVALSEQLHSWTQRVYRFGCAFIHLSNLHDYHQRDPFLDLSIDDRNEIIEHIRYYHGYELCPAFTFYDVVPVLPKVFEKIRSNLECELRDLEGGTTGAENESG